jgi:TonB family protein
MLNWTATLWPVAAAIAIKSSFVITVAWLAALMLQRRSAAARHLVWTACAAALVALPLLSISLPALRIHAADAILPGDPGIVFRSDAVANAGAPPGPKALAPGSSTAPTHAAPIDWRPILLYVWACGAAIVFLQLLSARIGLRRIRRAATPSPCSREAALLANALGLDSPVRVLETPGSMPMTFGILRPAILLPSGCAGWSASRLRMVLLHELAHVRRGDAATHLLAQATLLLYWWNPLAWTAWREFLKERERAADDMVLATGAAQSEYAGHLLEIARSLQAAPIGAAAIAMARPSQLEGRLLAILSDGVNRRSPGRAAAAIAAAAAVAVVLPIAAVRAQSTAAPADVDATIRAATTAKNHQLLEPAADVYEKLHKYKEAQTLREASLTIREQQNGQSSAQYAEGLVLLGNLAAKRGAGDESLMYYRRALQYGDRPEVFPALLRLGMHAWSQRRMGAVIKWLTGDESARDYLRRARNVASNPNDMSRATTWMANAESDPATAESLYRSAVSAAEYNSSEQALALEFFARFLNEQGRPAEAEPLVARAKEIRQGRILALSAKSGIALSSAMKVGKGVSAPSLLAKIEPEYSEDARVAKIQGAVTLAIVVDTDGRAKDVRVIKGVGYGLDEKAVEAVGNWEFRPGTMNGEPVQVQAQIEINFRLL